MYSEAKGAYVQDTASSTPQALGEVLQCVPMIICFGKIYKSQISPVCLLC